MKPKFLGEGCDVFMNEIEIRTKGKFEGEGLKKFQVLNKMIMIEL
jgi:hypothetical protein